MNTRITTTILALLLAAAAALAEVPYQVAWTAQIGTRGDDLSQSVAVDTSGNIYISGHTDGDLGGRSAGGYDAFPVKCEAPGPASVVLLLLGGLVLLRRRRRLDQVLDERTNLPSAVSCVCSGSFRCAGEEAPMWAFMKRAHFPVFHLLMVIALVAWFPVAARAEFPVYTGPEYNFTPMIDGDVVAWTQNVSGDLNVVWKPLLSSGAPQTITGTYNQSIGGVDGNNLVYSDTWPRENKGIWTYDVTTQAYQQVYAGSASYPRMDDSVVVWTQSVQLSPSQSTTTIRYQDLATGAEGWVYDQPGQYCPDVSGNSIVYRQWNYGSNLAEVWSKTIGSDPPTRLATSGDWPRVDGDYAVWQDYRDWPGGSNDIYARNLLTGEEIPIATGPANQEHPDISGTRVVWQESGKIEGYDLATAERFTVSDSGTASYPAISGDNVVWRDERNATPDIYGTVIGQEPNPTPKLHVIVVGLKQDAPVPLWPVMRGDLDATAVYEELSEYPAWAQTNPSPILLDGNAPTNAPGYQTGRAQIETALNQVMEQVRPGDTFLFFYAGHMGADDKDGGERPVTYQGTAALWGLHPNADENMVFHKNNNADYISDDWLKYLLTNEAFVNVNKLVVLAGCQSGGFWGIKGDNDSGDLEELHNIGLLAACAEGVNTAYAFDGHIPYAKAFLEAATRGPAGFAAADIGRDGLTFNDLAAYLDGFDASDYLGQEMPVAGFGPGPGDGTQVFSWSPVAYGSSADFSGRELAVPEPATMSLLALGACLPLFRRKRR